MLKHSSKYERIHSKNKLIISVASSFWFATNDATERIDKRALVVESGVFLCRYHSTVALHAHMSPGEWTRGPIAAAFQRHSLTLSTWWSYFGIITNFLIMYYQPLSSLSLHTVFKLSKRHAPNYKNRRWNALQTQQFVVWMYDIWWNISYVTGVSCRNVHELYAHFQVVNK
jgi:hypothetical protein